MAGRKPSKPAEDNGVTPKDLLLPVSVVGPTDIVRLIRELESLDEAMLQLSLRKEGAPETKLPKTSKLMDQIAHVNKLNLLKKPDRQGLEQFLKDTKKQSPVMHISFSADPSPAFLEKLMSWLRREIDPAVLLTIGLQPNVGAGCIVRTTNKQFDFSLRQDFAKKRDLLLQQIAGERAEKSAPERPAEPTTSLPGAGELS